MNTALNTPHAQSQDFNLEQVKMAIFWRTLGELDIYTTSNVTTMHGFDAQSTLYLLKDRGVSVEVMD